MKTILVFTNAFNYGKADNLTDALKNAKYKKSQKVSICMFDCKPEDVEVDDFGRAYYPENAKQFYLTNGYEKI